MHVSLLFKMYDSVCHIKSEFGRNSQDGRCAFKLELVRHRVNFPCQFLFMVKETSDYSERMISDDLFWRRFSYSIMSMHTKESKACHYHLLLITTLLPCTPTIR